MLQDLQARGIYLTEDEYRSGLRALFPEDYQNLSDAELEDIIYQRIGSLSPSEAESLMESFGSWLTKTISSAAPIVTAVLPAVATVAGTALGGPLGGALGGMAGQLAAGAIGNATRTQPNPHAAGFAQAATAIAGGNAQAGLTGVMSTVGNLTAGGGGGGAAPRVAPRVPNRAPAAPAASAAPASTGGQGSTQAASQLLSFISSTPLLQGILSSLVTGNVATGLQIPREDGSSVSTSYVELLEALRHLTENALIEADNLGFSFSLPLESEADQTIYLESLIEDVGAYENSLLPNYDVITY